MTNWIEAARERIGAHGAVVRASLVGVKGSAPREAGAMMLITEDDIWQTIGGGTLEFTVMTRAREMLADSAAAPWARTVMRAALGPDMGQCCGGQVRVLLERFASDEDAVLADLKSCRAIAHPMDGSAPLGDAGDTPPGLDRETVVLSRR